MSSRAGWTISDFLRLMRLPLAVTAITNAQAALVLRTASQSGDEWSWGSAISLAAMSLGLYGFGLVSNDIVDYRRDLVMAPDRPLPAGRVSMQQAYLLAAGLLILGVGGGLVYATIFQGEFWRLGIVSSLFLGWTLLLILFYNVTGKFVGAVGILTLGLIRFFHAAIAQPGLPVVWHPLLIMDHVIVISAVAYSLEGRRPRLAPIHWWMMALGTAGFNLLFVSGLTLVQWWRLGSLEALPEKLGISQALIYPATAAAVFAALAAAMVLSLRAGDETRRQRLDLHRRTGRRLMIFGLLWLVLYDLAFVYGYLREL